MIAEALGKLFGIAERAVSAEQAAKLATKEVYLGRGKRILMFADGERLEIQKRPKLKSQVRLDHFPQRALEIIPSEQKAVIYVNDEHSWLEVESDGDVKSVWAGHEQTAELRAVNSIADEGWMTATQVVSYFSLNLQDCFAKDGDFRAFVKCFRSLAAERKRTQTASNAGATYGATIDNKVESKDGKIDDWEHTPLNVKCIEGDFITREKIRLVMECDPDTLRFKFNVVAGDIDAAVSKTTTQVINWMSSKFKDPLANVSVVCGQEVKGFESVE